MRVDNNFGFTVPLEVPGVDTQLMTPDVTQDTAAVDRSDRSVDRAIGSMDSIDSINFWIFWPCQGARNLSGVKVSALYDAWRPKKLQKTKTKKFGIFVKFDSIDSIICSIRSKMCRWAMVDRPGKASQESSRET